MKHLLITLNIWVFGIILIQLFACEKENDSLGLNTNEGALSSASADTFRIRSYSKQSKNSPSNSGTSVFIGGYNSSELGSLSSTTYSSLAPTDLTFRFPEGGISIDSVILSIDIKSVYGKGSKHTFEIKQTEQSVEKEKTYYASNSLTTGSSLGSFELNDNDTGIVTFRINNSYAEDIVQQGDLAFTTTEVFIDLFKGIAILPTASNDSNQGAIFGISSRDIVITVYFKENSSDQSGSLSFAAPSGSRSFYGTSLQFEGSEVNNQLNSEVANPTHFFLQGLGSVKASLEFPFLNNWYTADKRLINKAILTLPVTKSSNEDFSAPESIVVHLPNDASNEGIQATLDTELMQYKLDIEPLLSAQLIQGEDCIFDLSLLNSFAHPEQLQLNGFDHPSNPIKIDIFYTKY